MVVPPIVEMASRNTEEEGDVLGLGPEERIRWADGLNLPKGPVNGTIFYAGEVYPVMGYAEGAFRLMKRLRGLMNVNSLAKATPLFKKLGIYRVFAKASWSRLNERYERALRDSVYVLRELGVQFGFLYEEEPPSGIALHTYGLLDEFKEHATEVARKFRELGVTRIITLDPIAATAFKHYYPVFTDFNVKVEHFVQVVAKRMAELGVKASLGRKLKVTYHDPCYLARVLGVVDEVRYILSRIEGVELIEPERHGVNTGCSGDGGLELTQPELARKVSYERVKELASTKADLTLTSCPACIMMLRVGFDELAIKMDVLDLASLIAEALRNGFSTGEGEVKEFREYRVLPETLRWDLSSLEEKLREYTDVCKKCGFCNSVCPTAQALDRLESRSARGRMTLINALVRGDPVRPDKVLDRLYSCVLCGSCSQTCPVGLHVQEIIVYGRAYAIKTGRV